MMCLEKIEKRIVEIKREIAEKPSELKAAIPQAILNKRITIAIKPLENELEILEAKRRFILDKRDGLPWRFIWNVVVPIVVSTITAFIVSKIIAD